MRTGSENNVNHYLGPNLSIGFGNITYLIDIFHKIWNLGACTCNSWELENWPWKLPYKTAFINILLKLSSVRKFGVETSFSHRNKSFNLVFELLHWIIAAQSHENWVVLITRKRLVIKINSKKLLKWFISKNFKCIFFSEDVF